MAEAVRETHSLHLQTHPLSGRRMVNQYVIEDEIGRGVHGRVRRARNVHTDERVALKIVEREARPRLGAPRPAAGERLTDEKVLREIAIMKKCRHPNIVQLREAIDDPHSRKIFIVLEYMDGGEVVWRTPTHGPALTVAEARRTLRDVVLGLEYLHHQGIVHRDIKPANLLWDAQHTVKISDFGVSYLCAPAGDTRIDEAELSKTAGSPAFFAPELCVAGDDGSLPPVTRAIDVWALGITLYCLLFGHPPFTAASEFALFHVIPAEDYALPEFMGADRVQIGPRAPRWGAARGQEVPPATRDACDARDLLDRLLEKDPRRRITLAEVKQHPWVVRDLDADAWLAETDPSHIPSVQVGPHDVEHALSGFSRIKQQIKRLHTLVTGTLHRGRQRSNSETGTRTYSTAFTPGGRLFPRRASAASTSSVPQAPVSLPASLHVTPLATPTEMTPRAAQRSNSETSARTYGTAFTPGGRLFPRRASAASTGSVPQAPVSLPASLHGTPLATPTEMTPRVASPPAAPPSPDDLSDLSDTSSARSTDSESFVNFDVRARR